MVSLDEFNEWLHNPVTRDLMSHIRQTIEDSKELLANEAGVNQNADRQIVGGISAFREILEWKPEIHD